MKKEEREYLCYKINHNLECIRDMIGSTDEYIRKNINTYVSEIRQWIEEIEKDEFKGYY